EHNASLKAARAGLQAAAGAVGGEAAGPRPSLAIQGSGTLVVNEDTNTQSIGLGLNQQIDLWGKMDLQLRQAVLSLAAQRAAYREQANSLLARAERLFWQGTVTRQKLALYDSLVEQRTKDLELARKRYDLGAVPRLDVVRAQVQLEKVRAQRSTIQAELRDILAGMRELVGNTEFVRPSREVEPPALPQSLREGTIDGNPALRRAEVALQATSVDRELAALGMRPTLSANLSYTAASNAALSSEGDILLALDLTVPLYDGGRTKNAAERARHLQRQAEQNLAQARHTLRRQLEEADNRWEKAIALEHSRSEEVRLAREELRITRLRYNTGVGSQADLLDARREEEAARSSYLDVLQEMHLSLVSLREVQGRYAADLPEER
ncbi:MAG: TolC family protein, partial [Synergistales bacterium]|nr:TolC family protein [Synergistales bacterium]